MDGHGSSQARADRRRGATHGDGTPARRRQGGPVDPSALGQAAHDVIAALAADGVRTAEYERVSVAVRNHAATSGATSRQQAAHQWLASTASLYFRLFALPAGWDLAGVEVRAPHCRFDLLWRNRFGGDVLADELKTGKAGDLVGGAALEHQLERERRDGVELYGERFLGVRLLVLGAPRRSLFLARDGSRTPLYPEDRT